jgi:hypothetical protein
MNPDYPEKTTDLLQVIDNRNHLMLYQEHLAMSRTRPQNVSGDRPFVFLFDCGAVPTEWYFCFSI